MTRLVSRWVSLRACASAAAVFLLWSAADHFGGPLSGLAVVTVARADNGGSGSGGSGGGKSGSGKSENGKSENGKSESGKSGRGKSGSEGSGGGDEDGDKDAEKAERAERRSVERFLSRLREKGSVNWAQVRDEGVEVRYADGWSESVSGGRYQLFDTRRRVVTDRPATRGDLRRLAAAAATR
jgi:hypothetical protein